MERHRSLSSHPLCVLLRRLASAIDWRSLARVPGVGLFLLLGSLPGQAAPSSTSPQKAPSASASTSSPTAPSVQATHKLPPSAPMGCDAAIQYALRHNPDFRATRAGVRVALQRLRASRIFPTNPEIEVVGKGKVKSEPGKIKAIPYKLENELTWKMPIGGRWTSRQRWARATLQRVQQELKAARMTLTFKVQKACYNVLVARQKAALYTRLTAFYRRVVQLIQRRKQTGAATVLDLNLARMELLRAQAALSLAQADVKVNTQVLAGHMGWSAPPLPSIRDTIPRSLYTLPPLAALQKQSQHHFLLQVVARRIKELKASLAWAYAKAIPDLKLKLFYALEDGFNHIVGGGIAIPLPFAQRNQSKVWTTRAKLRQTRLKMRALRFKIQQRVLQTYTRYQAVVQVLRLYEKQLLPTFQQQIKLRERGLRLGNFTVLQVISAQQSQNKALLQRIDVLKQTLSGLIALQQAVGSPLRRTAPSP